MSTFWVLFWVLFWLLSGQRTLPQDIWIFRSSFGFLCPLINPSVTPKLIFSIWFKFWHELQCFDIPAFFINLILMSTSILVPTFLLVTHPCTIVLWRVDLPAASQIQSHSAGYYAELPKKKAQSWQNWKIWGQDWV